MTEEERYMMRCLQLAQLGAGHTSPNPMVGAVIVHKGEIIGEGYHRKYGEAHAEVNAINSVADKSLLREATLYVNLEPCSHWGKTPPCADMIVQHGLKKCVIANRDVNPKVNGGGIKKLTDNGIEVVCGVLEEEARFVNRRFFTNHTKGRPYVIIKYAKSRDGYLAPSKGNEWISNEAMRVWVHKQRMEEDAIMAGYNTIVKDNPRLDVRHYYGNNPTRVVWDRNLSLDRSLNVLDNSRRTIVFNLEKNAVEGMNTYVRINEKDGVEEQILDRLFDHGVRSLIVEGGRKTIEGFLSKGLWDQANIITGKKVFHSGIKAPGIPNGFSHSCTIGEDVLEFYYNE